MLGAFHEEGTSRWLTPIRTRTRSWEDRRLKREVRDELPKYMTIR